jgi:tRNA(fMet)-specific endonuclease VapC
VRVRYLLDSNFLIAYLRGDKPAEKRFVELIQVKSDAVICTAVYLEVAAVELARGAKHARTVQMMLELFEVLDFTFEVAVKAAREQARLLRSNTQMSIPDLEIAATAVHTGRTVLSRNGRHLNLYTGCKVESF